MIRSTPGTSNSQKEFSDGYRSALSNAVFFAEPSIPFTKTNDCFFLLGPYRLSPPTSESGQGTRPLPSRFETRPFTFPLLLPSRTALRLEEHTPPCEERGSGRAFFQVCLPDSTRWETLLTRPTGADTTFLRCNAQTPGIFDSHSYRCAFEQTYHQWPVSKLGRKADPFQPSRQRGPF